MAASNAKVHGKDSDFWLNGVSTEDDGNRVAITITNDTAEDTSFVDSAKSFLEGDYGWTVSYDGFWNAGATRNDQTFYELIGTGGKEMKFFPNGSASGRVWYMGTVILTSYTPEAVVAGPVTASAEFQGVRNLSHGTIA